MRNTEGTELVFENTDILVYTGSINGLAVNIVYVFVADIAVRGRFVVSQEHSFNNQYISDFNTLKALLTIKYGNPTSDDQYWLNDLYKDDFQEWGNAVAASHLSYYTKWENGKSEVLLALSGDNYQISLSVEYQSKEFAQLEKSKQLESELDNL